MRPNLTSGIFISPSHFNLILFLFGRGGRRPRRRSGAPARAVPRYRPGQVLRTLDGAVIADRAISRGILRIVRLGGCWCGTGTPPGRCGRRSTGRAWASPPSHSWAGVLCGATHDVRVHTSMEVARLRHAGEEGPAGLSDGTLKCKLTMRCSRAVGELLAVAVLLPVVLRGRTMAWHGNKGLGRKREDNASPSRLRPGVTVLVLQT